MPRCSPWWQFWEKDVTRTLLTLSMAGAPCQTLLPAAPFRASVQLKSASQTLLHVGKHGLLVARWLHLSEPPWRLEGGLLAAPWPHLAL